MGLVCCCLTVRVCCAAYIGASAYVSWDAYSVAANSAAGSAIAEWANSGMLNYTMVGYGYGGVVPTLQYEDGVPHVQLDRVGSERYAWFTANGPLTLPAPSPTGPGSGNGMTIVVVARLWPTDPSSTQWEKILMCGDGADQNALFVGRYDASMEMDVGYLNSNSPHYGHYSQLGDAISGRWEAYIFRLGVADPIASLYMRDRFVSLAPRSHTPPAPPIALPRTVSTCHIGHSFPPYEPVLNGSLREVSIYMEVFSDQQMAAEYQRMVSKWRLNG